MRASPSAGWSIREHPLGRVHVERLVGDVVVRLEVYSGGGFCASTAVWRVAARVVAMVEAAEA